MNDASDTLTSAKESVTTTASALVQAQEDYTSAVDKYERAKAIVLSDAMEEPITDEDYAYLNSYVDAIKAAQAKVLAAQADYDDALSVYDTSSSAYEKAHDIYLTALSELAKAQVDYEALRPVETAYAGESEGITNEVNNLTTEKVVEGKKSSLPATGDAKTDMAVAIAAAGAALLLSERLREREAARKRSYERRSDTHPPCLTRPCRMLWLQKTGLEANASSPVFAPGDSYDIASLVILDIVRSEGSAFLRGVATHGKATEGIPAELG